MGELEKPVALDAGIRGSSARVFVEEVTDNLLLEDRLHVDYHVLYADLFAYSPSRRCVRIRLELHCSSDDVEAGFFQEKGCDRAVNASADGGENAVRHGLLAFLLRAVIVHGFLQRFFRKNGAVPFLDRQSAERFRDSLVGDFESLLDCLTFDKFGHHGA